MADRLESALFWADLPQADRDILSSGLRALLLLGVTAFDEGRWSAAGVKAEIAHIDNRVHQQLNLILHDASLQALEGSWRGLHGLVERAEPDAKVRIRALSVRKDELMRSLELPAEGAWLQVAWSAPFREPHAEPFSCCLIDLEFYHSPPDMQALSRLAAIASDLSLPLVVAASPYLMQMETWRELVNPRDLGKIFNTPEYEDLRRLRQSDLSEHIVLVLPRLLARRRWTEVRLAAGDSSFNEDIGGSDRAR
jgi:type VI secretion system protein ImpC